MNIMKETKVKKNNKIKKAIPTIKKVEIESYELQCPYCKNIMFSGFSKNILKLKCFRCEEPIEIQWDEKIENNNSGIKDNSVSPL